jgi:hypothetical protein
MSRRSSREGVIAKPESVLPKASVVPTKRDSAWSTMQLDDAEISDDQLHENRKKSDRRAAHAIRWTGTAFGFATKLDPNLP